MRSDKDPTAKAAQAVGVIFSACLIVSMLAVTIKLVGWLLF